MKSIDYVMLLLSATALVIAGLEYAGAVQLRIDSRVMILLGVAFAGRVVIRQKLQGRERQRQMMLREVPRRPLGIEDEDRSS